MAVHFDLEFAQELCDLVARDLGYGCSFMGDGGVIIASSVRQRIGRVHDGAARIMRRELNEFKVNAEEASRSKEMREGVSIGIDFDGKRVASCGIAGELERVVPLAKAMSLFVRSMMRRDQDDKMRIAEVANQKAKAAGISTQITKAKGIANAAASASHKTDSSVETLTQASGRIGQVAEFIQEIASQTQLLALNATMEAVRAGDSGKGFLVVANEIKQLARQTAKATGDIARQIGQVQSATVEVQCSTAAIAATIAEVNTVIASVAESSAV